MSETGVVHADRSGDTLVRIANRTTWADALHQGGEPERAQALFDEAEALEASQQRHGRRLYSAQGYLSCDLLLARSRAYEVRARAAMTLEWARQRGLLLDIALDHLSLARAALLLSEHNEARTQLDHAVDGLREAGHITDLPLGLLARAALFRVTDDFDRARRDLDETMRIARRSEMRLFQCDAHLEYARLALAEGGKDRARGHVAAARRLVEETGYGRRRPEVEELETQLVG